MLEVMDHSGQLCLGNEAMGQNASRLRGPVASFLPPTEEESYDALPAQTNRKLKGRSGKLWTADTTIVHRVTWPH